MSKTKNHKSKKLHYSPKQITKKKIKTHIDEKTKTLVISLLIQGLSLRHVSQKLTEANIKLTHEAIRHIKIKNLAHIDKVKKENREIMLETDNEKYKKVVSGFLDVTRRAVNHITDKKLEESSGAALATIAGIMTDKHALASGGPTDRVEIKFKSKGDMLDYIRKRKDKK